MALSLDQQQEHHTFPFYSGNDWENWSFRVHWYLVGCMDPPILPGVWTKHKLKPPIITWPCWMWRNGQVPVCPSSLPFRHLLVSHLGFEVSKYWKWLWSRMKRRTFPGPVYPVHLLWGNIVKIVKNWLFSRNHISTTLVTAVHHCEFWTVSSSLWWWIFSRWRWGFALLDCRHLLLEV